MTGEGGGEGIEDLLPPLIIASCSCSSSFSVPCCFSLSGPADAKRAEESRGGGGGGAGAAGGATAGDVI